MTSGELPGFPGGEDPTLKPIKDLIYTMGVTPGGESVDHTSDAPKDSSEETETPHTLATECLETLLALSEVAERGRRQRIDAFFRAFTGLPAPDDLYTHIHMLTPNAASEKVANAPGDVIASIVVDFRSTTSRFVGQMINLDFVDTPAGMRIYQREWTTTWGEQRPEYTRRLAPVEVQALQQDTQTSRDRIVEADMERLRMGLLEEAPNEHGDRRFHVGDVLSILARQFLSARGAKGVYDILTYMTGERPATTQLPRFLAECAPKLEARYPALRQLLGQYFPDREIDDLEHYKLLNALIEELGVSLLEVDRLDSSQHTRMDPGTEFTLDYGREIEQQVVLRETDEDE